MVIESQYAPINIPDLDIWGFLFEQSIEFPEDKVIYVDPLTKRQYTFKDVKKTAIGFGHALRTLWNWQKGDVMGVFAANCIDTPALTFGTLWANGVVSPANPAYSAAELAFQLSDSGAKALLTQAHFLKAALEAAKIAGIPESRILVIGDVKDRHVAYFTDFINSSRIEVGGRKTQAPSDLAIIPYSSGTTGLPKGVMLTQRNIVSNLLMMDTLQNDITEDDAFIAVLPFYHVYGLSLLILHTIYKGAKVVVLPGFQPDLFLKAIQDYKITYGYVVPPILLFLSKSPIVDNYDIRSMKVFLSAAAPLTQDLVLDVYNRLRIPVKQAYGLSETSPGTHVQRIEDWRTTMGSVGRLLPNMTAKYVSEAGEELPAGSVGELWVKGPNVFAGYWKNEIATTNCMTPDGYFKTGDIGYQDKDGHFYITDRLKELIKYKGFQVAPAELEGLLVGYEKVADACVVGIYDDSLATELPLAFVVKAAAVKNVSDHALESDIQSWIEGKVANHKKLRGGIRFVDEIPKSAAGKILRRVLRDQIKAEVERRANKPRL